MKDTDRVVSIAFLIIAAIFFSQTLGLPDDAKNYPRSLIGIMTFLSILLFIKSFFVSSTKSWQDLFGEIEWKRFIVVLLASLLYMFLMTLIGFFVTSTIYLVGLIFFLKGSRKTVVIATSVFITSLFIIFKVIFNIPLPTGVLI